MDEQRIYRAALAAWGADAQTLMVFEEMAELQKELCKAARGRDNREQIAELLCVSRTTVWRMTKELEKTKASESQGPPIMPELPAKRQRNIVENQ